MLLDLEIESIGQRVRGSDCDQSMEHQHVQCVLDRARLYEAVLDYRAALRRAEAALEDARGAAKTLAHAFHHDSQPPSTLLAKVYDWPAAARTNPDAPSQG